MHKKHLKLTIHGMSCNGCAASISKALGRLEGIINAKVDFAKEQADIVFDEQAISKSVIVQTIEELGYQVAGEL